MNKRLWDRLRRVKAFRREADRSKLRAAAATRGFCVAMTGEGYSTREIGEMLGISGVAVHKLLRTA